MGVSQWPQAGLEGSWWLMEGMGKGSPGWRGTPLSVREICLFMRLPPIIKTPPVSSCAPKARVGKETFSNTEGEEKTISTPVFSVLIYTSYHKCNIYHLVFVQPLRVYTLSSKLGSLRVLCCCTGCWDIRYKLGRF